MKAAPTAALGGGALWTKERSSGFSQPSKGGELPPRASHGGGGAAAPAWQAPPPQHQLYAAAAPDSELAPVRDSSGRYLGPVGATAQV
jgi:hypothetical protein